MLPIEYKVCVSCRQKKHKSKFNLKPTHKTGLKCRCKTCELNLETKKKAATDNDTFHRDFISAGRYLHKIISTHNNGAIKGNFDVMSDGSIQVYVTLYGEVQLDSVKSFCNSKCIEKKVVSTFSFRKTEITFENHFRETTVEVMYLIVIEKLSAYLSAD